MPRTVQVRILSAFLILAAWGCQIENKPIYSTPALVVCAKWGANHNFFVDGVNIGGDQAVMIDRLKKIGYRQVIFKSDYPLDAKAIQNFEELFKESNIKVTEFWVPKENSLRLKNLKDKNSAEK